MSSPKPGGLTLAKAFSILRLLASSHASRFKLVDIARVCQLDKSTTSRLVQALLAEGALAKDAATGQYRPGPLLYELGLAALPSVNLRAVSGAQMEQLASATGDTVFLLQRSGFESVCLDHCIGTYPVQTLTTGVGDRHPLGVGGGGLAILAAMDDAEIARALAINRQRYIAYELDTSVLLQQVEETRSQGFALNEGFATPGAAGLGSPILNSFGHPVGAIFVASVTERMLERKHHVAKLVILAAEKVTERYREFFEIPADA